MRKILLSLLLLIPLTACSLWNDYARPETPTPQAWNGAKETGAWPPLDWWTQFKSPQLTTLITQAQTANFDLQAAVARVRQADAQLQIAGASLLPSVNATAGGMREKSSASKGAFVSSATKPFNTTNASVSAAYELDFWGKNWSAQESARALAEASKFDQEVVALTITTSVANTYFAILGTQVRLQAAQENLKTAQQLLDSFHIRFEQGIATALDVAQQENLVATARAAVPPLVLALQQNIDALSILLGKLPEEIAAPQGTLADIAVPEVTPGLPSELLQRRPDVQEAEANLISANANIINARAQFFPSISLTGERGYASNTLSSLFSPTSALFSLGTSIAQPIFEGGQLEGQLALTHAKYDELLADYRKSIVAAFSDVEDALSGVQQNAALEAAQEENVNTAQHAYELSQQQLQGGIVDITTVLNTERSLFAAQDALAQAKIAHLQSVTSLYKALGGGWKGQAD